MITGIPLSTRIVMLQLMMSNNVNSWDQTHRLVRLFRDNQQGELESIITVDPTRIEANASYQPWMLEIPTQFEITASDYIPLDVGQYKFNISLYPPNDRWAITNTSEIVFPTATTDWGEITHACFATKWFGKPSWAVSNDTALFYVKFDTPKYIYAGDKLVIPENNMKLYTTSRVV